MRIYLLSALLLVGGCQQQAPVEQRGTPVNAAVAVGSPMAPIANEVVPDRAAAPAPPAKSPAPEPAWPGTLGGLPDDRTLLSEPKGPIDPKSSEGAGQVVQLYAALIGEGKFAQADKAWRAGIEQGLLARKRLAAMREVRGQVGKEHDQEGAAGSLFIKVPLRIYGLDASGKRFNAVGDVTLRRVNDVDGASADQLRWHIVESDLTRKG